MRDKERRKSKGEVSSLFEKNGITKQLKCKKEKKEGKSKGEGHDKFEGRK